ncbi:MAG: site-specific integrase, partial [Burkholderiaceae bacterium]|nr:site-specific integrase [Burkholderiaceae bacterium]
MNNTAARQRKLHMGHFAFMRAVVQGVDLRASWERYLRIEGEANDKRLVRSTITWIREEFALAAKRESRYGTARLVRLDVAGIADPAQELPSLEVFAASHCLEGYSEAEQIAAYEAEYGHATQRQRQRAKLVAKQLEALRWLEGLVAQPPRGGDAVAAWLNPTLTSHLQAADIFTLAQLVERINGIGRRWHAGINAMGQGKAQRIAEWLREHEATIGLRLGAHVTQPRSRLFAHELNAVVAPATEIRPLEKFILPTELDGSNGVYRRPQAQCLLKASDDYQAILAWLRAKRGLNPEQKAKLNARRRQRGNGVEQGLDWLQSLSHTQRAYRKEAERFLLWAIVHKAKALSSMTNEDCAEYRDFLADPQPRSRWCGDRGRERWSPLWRPFEGPLSTSAQRHAITILKNLYGFLVDQNYLMGNPWSALGAPRDTGPKLNAGRSLTLAQWLFVQQQLDQLENTSANQRLAFALKLLYATGLRLSEIVAATVDDLQWVEYPPDAADDEPLEGWMLSVLGKGQQEREVPVPIEVINELAKYLGARGLDPDPENIGNQGAHLLGRAVDADERAPGLNKERLRKGIRFDPRAGVAATTLYDQIKAFFTDCAEILKGQGDAKGAERLAKASTHWMRHSHASHAIAGGM